MFESFDRYGIMPENYRYYENSNNYNLVNRNDDMAEIIQIIVDSINDEKEDEMFYDFLIRSTATREDQDMITSIRNDERHHRELLKEVYKSLTGKPFTESQNRDMAQDEKITYMQGLRKAFMGEITAFERYRKVLSRMIDRQNYNKIFEIMTDEMKHAIKYNYLIAKNLV